MSPALTHLGPLLVGDEASVHGVRDAPFQGAEGFLFAFAFGESLVVVTLPGVSNRIWVTAAIWPEQVASRETRDASKIGLFLTCDLRLQMGRPPHTAGGRAVPIILAVDHP